MEFGSRLRDMESVVVSTNRRVMYVRKEVIMYDGMWPVVLVILTPCERQLGGKTSMNENTPSNTYFRIPLS
jgi:hypothetical protein